MKNPPKNLVPGNPGNSGGKPGRSGRKPNSWRRFWRAEINKDAVIAAARAILSDPKHSDYRHVLKWAAEQGYGKPSQELTVKGDETAPLTIRLVRE